MSTATLASIEEIARKFRAEFPDDKFRQFLAGCWPEVGMPGPNELGPRVTGGSVYKPEKPLIVSTMGERVRKAAEKSRLASDRVEVEYEVATRKVTGFNIHLVREKKTIFMPAREAESEVSMIDQILLKSDPEQFAKKWGNSMIITARKQLREGKVGTPDELEAHLGEAWMSPEQIAVLVDLRSQRG